MKAIFNPKGYDAGRNFIKSLTVIPNVYENGKRKIVLLQVKGKVEPIVIEAKPKTPGKLVEP